MAMTVLQCTINQALKEEDLFIFVEFRKFIFHNQSKSYVEQLCLRIFFLFGRKIYQFECLKSKRSKSIEAIDD